MARHRQTDAAVRGRIYVSSRTSPPKNGVLATEEGSIYGRSNIAIRPGAVLQVARQRPFAIASPSATYFDAGQRFSLTPRGVACEPFTASALTLTCPRDASIVPSNCPTRFSARGGMVSDLGLRNRASPAVRIADMSSAIDTSAKSRAGR